MIDLSLHQLVIRAGACLLLTAIHGLALAAIARSLGQRGPPFDGRLTANPFRHLDPLGAATMILSQLGWIRAIAIDPTKLRGGRPTLILCVFGSVAMTLAAVLLLLQLRIPVLATMPSSFAPTMIATLNESAQMCAWFAALNLAPLPPLTGAHLLIAARPALAPLLTKYATSASIALAALALVGVLQPVLQPVRDAVAGLLPRL